MPVVDISAKRLVRLVGKGCTRKKIIDTLPYIGLDIESEKGDEIRVEYSPNRPDYSTDYGIAEGLRGLLGIKTGMQKISVIKTAKYEIKVEPKISKIRPIIMGIFAKGVRLDGAALKQLIAMQEDLHAGIGRNRGVAAIGIHNADAITFPLVYTASPKSTEFVPLHSEKSLSLADILTKTETGTKYAHLVRGNSAMPILYDANKRVISFPPVINASRTALSTRTRNILVEITGHDWRAVEDVLSVIAFTLASAGCTLYEVRSKKRPNLGSRKISFRPNLVNQTLGLNLNTRQIISCLKRSRLDATGTSTISCTIPRNRFDILGEMDLVEEAALGYGIDKMDPLLPPQESSGQVSLESAMIDKVSDCMVGLGYTEVLNSSLAAVSAYDGLGNTSVSKMISVMNPQTQSKTVLRDSLIPGLFDVLSKNIHEQYPQNIYEIGGTFKRAKPIDEHTMIAAAISHKDASYTQAKSAVVAMLKRCFGVLPSTPASSHAALQNGHTADIRIKGKSVGTVGIASNDTLERLRIRQPVAVFEVNLSKVSDMLAKN